MTYGLPIGSLAYGAATPYEAPSMPVSENVLFLSPRDSDRATVSASTAVTSLPASNVQNQEPSRVWRSTSAADQHLDFTLATALACDAVAMAGFLMSADGVWRLKAYETAEDVGGDAVVDSGWQSVWPDGTRHVDPEWGPEVALLRVENESAWRYWRLELSDPGVGVTQIDVGRVALGRAVQFSINCDFDGGVGYAPNDIQEPNGYAQIFTDPRPSNRAFTMQWSALAQREVHATAMELTRLRGMGGDVFCFLDPAEVELFHKWSLQGLFTGRADYKPMPVWVTDTDDQLRMAWGFSLSLIQKR